MPCQSILMVSERSQRAFHISFGDEALGTKCALSLSNSRAARQEFGTYLLSILPENGRMPSAERTACGHPENCTEGSTMRPIHNPTSSCPPSPCYRNRDPSLVTLVPSRIPCLGEPFREMTLICNDFMRDGSLSAPLKQRDGHCLQAGGGLRTRVKPVSHQSHLLALGQIRRCSCTAAIP